MFFFPFQSQTQTNRQSIQQSDITHSRPFFSSSFFLPSFLSLNKQSTSPQKLNKTKVRQNTQQLTHRFFCTPSSLIYSTALSRWIQTACGAPHPAPSHRGHTAFDRSPPSPLQRGRTAERREGEKGGRGGGLRERGVS